MRKVCLLSLLLLVLGGVCMVGVPVWAQDAGDIDRLIGDLGSDDVAVRDRALEELVAIGPEAVPALKKAAESVDPEVSWRARRAMARIHRAEAEAAKPEERPDGAVRVQSLRVLGGPGSVSVSKDADGHIAVTIVEQDGAERITRTYEADSVEEFRQKYPEIAEKYGIREQGLGGIRIGPDPDDAFGDRMKGFEMEMERINELVRKMQERLQRGLQRNGQKDPWEDFFRSPLWEEDPFGLRSDRENPDAPAESEPAETRPRVDDLGIEVEDLEPALRSQLDLGEQEGVLVRSVQPGSAAARAGLAPFDVILEVQGRPVDSVWGFRRLLKDALASKIAEIRIVRAGEEKVLLVKSDPEK